jgi:hypothetical protein
VLAEDDLSSMFGIEIATPRAKRAGGKPARKSKSAPVRIPKATSAAARIRATTPRSPLALKRAIAKRLKERRERP